MLNILAKSPLRLTRSTKHFFSTYTAMKDALSRNLYSIELINKQVNRKTLAMAYTPGVGAVCEAVEHHPQEADTLTLRARSVAVVTNGSFLDATPDGVGPALDWIVAQIKYYSGLDPFPFVVSKEIDMEEALKDLCNAYGTVLYLDSSSLPNIPQELLVVRHQDVIELTKTEVTDAEKTANVLAYLIEKKKKGLAKKANLESGLNFQGDNFKNFRPYSHLLNDGRDIYTHALEMHEYYRGITAFT